MKNTLANNPQKQFISQSKNILIFKNWYKLGVLSMPKNLKIKTKKLKIRLKNRKEKK